MHRDYTKPILWAAAIFAIIFICITAAKDNEAWNASVEMCSYGDRDACDSLLPTPE